MKSNFDFLNEKFPLLAEIGILAEKYLYSDANSCLVIPTVKQLKAILCESYFNRGSIY